MTTLCARCLASADRRNRLPVPGCGRANGQTLALAYELMTYSLEQKQAAALWKINTATLPAAAWAAAPYINKDGLPSSQLYPFCLPPEHAALSLLPEVREDALALFAELGIPWHAGVDNGPSNHLLSSQVQCVNALGQMVRDAGRLLSAFGQVLELGEVLEIEPNRYLTFEYIGPTDFFGEVPDAQRVRGAHCTSVDAAFMHRRGDETELVLVEWKYTESYRRRTPDPARDEIRRGRYATAVADPSGPVRGELLPFELLLDEPFYQLVRQQLLAHELEKAGVADRVRIVHVLSRENEPYQQSIHRDEVRALGDTVSDVWKQLLRHPDRFISMDPVVFLDASITSREYAARYAADVVWNAREVMTAYDVEDPEDVWALTDLVDFEGDIKLVAGGVRLTLGNQEVLLPYPFRLAELPELALDIEIQVQADTADSA